MQVNKRGKTCLKHQQLQHVSPNHSFLLKVHKGNVLKHNIQVVWLFFGAVKTSPQLLDALTRFCPYCQNFARTPHMSFYPRKYPQTTPMTVALIVLFDLMLDWFVFVSWSIDLHYFWDNGKPKRTIPTQYF